MRGVAGPRSTPLPLVLPCRGRAGAGVAGGRTHPSGPPSRPPPCQGGGVSMVKGRSVDGLSAPLLLPLPGRGRVGVGVAGGRARPSGLPSRPPPCQGGGVSMVKGRSMDGPSVPLLLPLPGRGRVGVGGAGGRVRPSGPPSRPPPCQGGGVSMVKGRSMNGLSVPLLLPLPCRGRVGVGVTGGRARPSGPPSRPPPCQGGGVLVVRGRNVDGRGKGRRRLPPAFPFLFLPLPCRGRVGVGVAPGGGT